jgi:pimeloyl-ACP methyl ester carboxylesterase
MKENLMTVILAVSMAGGAYAQDIIGEWQGTLKAGEAEFRLVVHIIKGDDGNLKATLDSVYQGVNGIPVTSISLKDSSLSFTVDSIHGSYEGTVNPDGLSIEGTWTQRQSLPLKFERAAVPFKTEHKPAKPSDIDGIWSGTLEAGAITLRIVFHITNTEDGLTATMDSPDQNAKGLPVTAVTRSGSSLILELKQVGGKFEGKISGDLTTVDGTWTQGGTNLPLTLKRVKDATELERRRPQNPKKPYPYREEEVSYDNKAAGIRLAATLTVPPGNGPFPAVVLITGSGPQDRDESLLGHRPFLVLADYLTRQGITVLRADDRGIGQSGGNFATATTADFATDAEAGVAYLKTRPEADPQKIGLIGHSEGAIIAPMVAARNPDVAFLVMMAGSGVPGDEILVAQVLLISEASGRSHAQAEQSAAEEREILALVKQEKDNAVLEKELREKLAGKIPEARLGVQIKALDSPWFRYFVEYDPATALRRVTCPVLAITGEKDLQVPPKQNLPAIRKALEAAGNKNFEVVELPGLNHLFQTAKTGAPSEYAEIEETMSPVAIEKIASWILKR